MDVKPRVRVQAGRAPVVAATRPGAQMLGENTGFEAGRSARRLRGFVPSGLHVNQLIQMAGPTIVRRARHLARNAGYAKKAVKVWTAAVAGTGITPTAAYKAGRVRRAIHQLFTDWTDEADADELTDFYGLQNRVGREVFIAGECFVRLRDRRPSDGLTVPLQLQLIPSEMCPLDRNEDLGGGAMIRHGIEFSPIGKRVAYHFLRRHPQDPAPGGTFSATETVRVPAESVLHIYDPVDAGQIRGVSHLVAAIIKLFMLDQYDDAELDRKKIAALFAGFVTSDAPDDQQPLVGGLPGGLAEEDDLMPLEPGTMQRLRPGEKIDFSEPADVGGGYEAFQYRTLLQVAASADVPYAYLTGDMSKANYSALRGAVLEFKRCVEQFQHGVMVFLFCRLVWRAWMDRAVMAGALNLPGYETRFRDYRRVSWLPPKWDWVDPMKDAQAEVVQIENGLKSRTQAVAERGYDIDELDEQIAADKAREKRLGLEFGKKAQAPAPIAAPADDAAPKGMGDDDEASSAREE